MRLTVRILMLLVWVASRGPLPAQELLQPEDVANLAEVQDPRVSPDASRVLYRQVVPRRPDEDRGSNYSVLWLVPVAGGEPHAFTSRTGYARGAQWSPDGRRIAFLDRRPHNDAEAKAQIHVIPVDGGEAQVVTRASENVSEFVWAPDGQGFFYVSREEKGQERKDAEEKGQDWVVADQDLRHLRLYHVDLETRQSRQVTQADLSLRQIAVSPDGRRVAALAAETPRVDDSYVFVELVTVDVASGEVEVVWDMPGKAASPRWSRDGAWLGCLAGTAAHDPLPGSLYLVPAAGGEARNLTPEYPGTVEWYDFDARGDVLLVATHGSASHLRRISLATGEIESLLVDGPVYTSAHLSADGSTLAASASTPRHPREIFVTSVEDAGWTRLTTSYPHLEGIPLGRQEVVEWRARDGLRIEGILVYPLDYTEGRTYPLVVGVHGGPEGAVLNGWHTGYGYLSQLLAHRGAFFLMPNYRGSSGRGVGFLLGDHGDPVGAEFQDVLDGVAALAERGLVDRDRVGIMGGSYGGYFSAWGATRETSWFRAAVVNYGSSSVWSNWSLGDIPWEHRLVHWGFFPVDRPFLAVDRSPVTWVRQSRTATLIMHGEKDPRVAWAQSRELYQGLRLNPDLPVEFVTFPREGHGYREAPHRLEACRRALEWLVVHLGLSAPETPSAR